MSQFKDEILEHYIDSDFLITSDRDPQGVWSGGNQLLTTACYYILLCLMDGIELDDITLFCKAFQKCEVRTYTGLLNRNPDRPDLESWDDYHIATASYFLKTMDADCIYRYGSNNNWCFDNTNPGKFSFSNWHGRYPGQIGYYALCADKSPGFIQASLLTGNILANAYSTSADAKIKGWLRYLVVSESNHPSYKKVCAIWEKKFKEQFGTLGRMFAAYGYKPNHPFTQIDSCLSF